MASSQNKHTAPSQDKIILEVLREVLERQAQLIEQQRLSSSLPHAPESTSPQPSVSTAQAQQLPPNATEGDPIHPKEAREYTDWHQLAAQPLTTSNIAKPLRAIITVMLMLLIIVHLPLGGNLSLANALPDRQALIVRDGLIFKGSGPEVYFLQNNQRRWISSLSAFQYLGYRWSDVHVVDDSFVNSFPEGKPLHVLLKCNDSPHIYRIEREAKHWIKDIPTFELQGHIWSDVHFVSCNELRNIPMGDPIPPDAGAPPQP